MVQEKKSHSKGKQTSFNTGTESEFSDPSEASSDDSLEDSFDESVAKQHGYMMPRVKQSTKTLTYFEEQIKRKTPKKHRSQKENDIFSKA